MRTEKTVKHETNCYWCFWNGHQKHGAETGLIRNQMKYWDHSDHNTDKIWKKILRRVMKTLGGLLLLKFKRKSLKSTQVSGGVEFTYWISAKG